MATSDIEYDIDLNTKKFDKATKSIDSQFNKMQKSTSSFAVAGVASLSAFVATTALATQGINKLVDETGQLETATVKWEVLTGSATEAERKIKDIFEFSNKTPFTFKGVNQATTTLYALTDGALNSMESIEQLGDRASKAGISINELAVQYGRLYSNMSSGRAMGEQLARMQELGIMSGTLRGELENLSKADLMSGKGWETFIQGTSDAEGMMEKLSQTIEGKLSTLEGVWDGIFAFEDDEIQQSIKNSIDTMIDTLNSNKPQIQGVIEDVFSVATNFVNDWVDGALFIYDLFKSDSKSFEAEQKQYAQSIRLQLRDASKADVSAFSEKQLTKLDEQKRVVEELRDTIVDTRFKIGGDGVLSGDETLSELVKLRDSFKGELFTDGIAKLDTLIFEAKKQDKLQISFDTSTKILNDIKKGVNTADNGDKKGNNKGGAVAKIPTSDAMTADELAGINPYIKLLAYQYDESMKLTGSDIVSETSGYVATPEELQTHRDQLRQDRLDAEAQALQDRLDFYANTTSIINDSESAILNIHEAWSADSISGMTRGFSGFFADASGILGTLGMADPSGITSVVGAGLGIFSSIAGLFESDDEDSSSTTTSNTTASTSRANIVSASPTSFNQTNNFEINTSYIGDDVGTAEFFDDKISPLIANASQASL